MIEDIKKHLGFSALILILCIWACFKAGIFDKNNNQKNFVITTTTDRIVIHDTIEKIVKVDSIIYKTKYRYKNRTIYVDSIIHDTLLIRDIIREFGADFYTKDTLVNDSNLVAIVTDTISQNKIKYRKFEYEVIKTINNSIYEKRYSIFAGGGFDSRNTYHIGLHLQQRKWLYGASYNFQDKAINLDVKYKIFSK